MRLLLHEERIRVGVVISAVCFVAGLALGAEPPAGEKAAGTLLVDESAYCRAYYRLDVQEISAKTLKAEGEKILGPALMGKLQEEVSKRLAGKHYDWQKEDWRDHVEVEAQYNSFARKNRVFLRLGSVTAAPVDAWRMPEFDDSTWLRERKPDGVGSPALYTCGTTERNGWLRCVFLRFRFEIPDAASAGVMTFGADYIGGIRAFVNGKEFVRGHLPDGDLNADTMAQDYPLEAYVAMYPDLPDKEKAKFNGKEPPPTQIIRSADELTAVGSRLYKLRNRTISTMVIPHELLRKGTNILAIELRAAPLHPYVLKEWFGYRGDDRQWEHARLSRMELRSTSKEVPSCVGRPRGVQIWTEDMTRRLFSAEYLERGAVSGVIRLVGARNGTYAAQVVVGADRDLARLKVTASELKNAGGGVLPAESIRVLGMNPQPMADISLLGEGRIVGADSRELGGGISNYGDWSAPKTRALVCFAPEALENKTAAAAALGKLQYFDWISSALPERIGADSCQPYWLSVKIGADAAPGTYRGVVRVEGPDIPAVTASLEVEVVDWRLVAPHHFQTIVAIEQSPYGVAKQYKIPLWSDKHWALIEASLRQLARAGNGVWFVPVLLDSEFGNKDDSMIKWIRKRDGSLAFDYANMDRYLDLIVKNCGTPRVIGFPVMHGYQGAVEVKVQDETSGREERLNLGPNASGREKNWQPFACSLYAHMVARGLNQAMFWGFGWDQDGDGKLKDLMRQLVPEVLWMCGTHDAHIAITGGLPDPDLAVFYRQTFAAAAWTGPSTPPPEPFYKVVENIQSFLIGAESQKGWKPRSQLLLSTPRVDSGAIVVNGTAMPWAFRIFPERAIFTGYRGTGRMGGDYWARSYYDGCKNGGGGPGFSIMKTLWPGPEGAEPSARFEAMIEGLEELEARIFVEQALDRGILPADMSRRVVEQMGRHYKGTFAAGLDWQDRSRRMYQLASEVAKAVGLDVAESEYSIAIKADAQESMKVTLRNWTDKPRQWKAEASEKWLVPSRSDGAATGIDELAIQIHGELLEPDRQTGGVLTITDLGSGHAYPVKIVVRTGKAAEAPGNVVLNVASGAEVAQDVRFANLSGKTLPWQAASSLPWLRVEPANGQVGAGGMVALKIIAKPPTGAEVYQSDLTLSLGGRLLITHVSTFVLEPYREPTVLQGNFIWLREALDNNIIKMVSHTQNGLNRIENDKLPPEKRLEPAQAWEGQLLFSSDGIPGGFAGQASYLGADRDAVPFPLGKKTYCRGLWVYPYHETTFDIAGRGIRAFSAEVGFNSGMKQSQAGVYFDIYVDGKIRTQSGLMTPSNEPRLVVVDGLDNARTLQLSTRRDNGLPRDIATLATWAHPEFYGEKLPPSLVEKCRKSLEKAQTPP